MAGSAILEREPRTSNVSPEAKNSSGPSREQEIPKNPDVLTFRREQTGVAFLRSDPETGKIKDRKSRRPHVYGSSNDVNQDAVLEAESYEWGMRGVYRGSGNIQTDPILPPVKFETQEELYGPTTFIDPFAVMSLSDIDRNFPQFRAQVEDLRKAEAKAAVITRTQDLVEFKLGDRIIEYPKPPQDEASIRV